MLQSFTAREVATPGVATVPPDASVRTAARHLEETSVAAVVVVNAAPTGIVTETDLRQVIAQGNDPERTPVSEIMSSPLVTVDANADLADAARRADEHHVSQLPVVDDEEIVGMVTMNELSYKLPELTADTGVNPHESLHTVDVRAGTAYEHEDWEFEYETSVEGTDDELEVGDIAHFSKTLTDDDVEKYAVTSGDTNQLYLDEEFAAATRFGRRVIHSTLTTSVVGALLTRLPGMTVVLASDYQYRGPIDIGTRVTASCEIEEQLSDHKFRLSVTLHDEEGDPVVVGDTTVLSEPLPSGA